MSIDVLKPMTHRLTRREVNDVNLLARTVENHLPVDEEVTPSAILRILDTHILRNYTASSRRQMVANLVRHFETQELLVAYVPELRALRKVSRPTHSQLTSAAQKLRERCDYVNALLDLYSSSFSLEGQYMAHALWATTVLSLPIQDWVNVQYDSETQKVFVWELRGYPKSSWVRLTIELLGWSKPALSALREGLILRRQYSDLLTNNMANLSMLNRRTILRDATNRLLKNASAMGSGRTDPSFLEPLTRLRLANSDGNSSIACRIEYYRCITGAPDGLPHMWFFRFGLATEYRQPTPAASRLLNSGRLKFIVPEFRDVETVVPLIAKKACDSDAIGREAPRNY